MKLKLTYAVICYALLFMSSCTKHYYPNTYTDHVLHIEHSIETDCHVHSKCNCRDKITDDAQVDDKHDENLISGIIIHYNSDEKFGIIKYCESNITHKFKTANQDAIKNSDNIEEGDIVKFKIVEEITRSKLIIVSLRKATHKEKYSHNEKGFHIRGHIQPLLAPDSIITFNQRHYIKTTVYSLDSLSCGSIDSIDSRFINTTWIPLDIYITENMDNPNYVVTNECYVIGIMNDINGNYIRIDGHKLAMEVLDNHPPHHH